MDASFFSLTLGLHSPWQITSVTFSDSDRVEIDVDFSRIDFTCPACGKPAAVTGLSRETWEHLDYFKYRAHLRARIPLVKCSHGCGTLKVAVPWSRAGSLFVRVGDDVPAKSVAEFAD
jgi:transposase